MKLLTTTRDGQMTDARAWVYYKLTFGSGELIILYDSNSAEVDIAPALGEKITACNVGQAKPCHGACMKSMSRPNTMQGFILLQRNAL